jgi:hypothetical protein
VFPNRIESIEELTSMLPPPSPAACEKELDRLDDHCRAFIERSPFAFLASAGPDGTCDASPRGGPPGFVRVLDDRRLLLPEFPGNRRFDSLRNLLERPGVGLLFLIPGLEDTLRVNGRASITRDPELLAESAVDGKGPRYALGVEVAQCFLHCPKAFRRSGLWQPEQWPSLDGLPRATEMLRDHVGLTLEELEESRRESLAKRLY